MQLKKLFSAIILYAGKVNAAISLGEAAQNALGPASMLADAFHSFCYIIGIGFIMGGFFQYNERRKRGPQAIPFSRPTILVILGIIIFFLPFVTSHSVSFSALG